MSDLQNLTFLVREAIRLEEAATSTSEQTTELKRELASIVEQDIPLLWLQMGLGPNTVLEVDGREVRAKPGFTHSIAGDRKPAAMQWLRDNGHSSILRTTVTVSFPVGSAKEAAELQSRLAKELGDTAEVALTDEIHSSTLRSWLGEILKTGGALPEDVFGLRALTSADIGKPKT